MFSEQELEYLLRDETKRISADIVWRDDQDHSPAREFRVQVDSEPGWPISVNGRWNPFSQKLSYTLIHDGAGRIIGLDLGDVEHPNPPPQRLRLIGTHKHRWTVAHRDKWAYVPEDITAAWDEPMEVWRQFCDEVHILHEGLVFAPHRQGGLSI